MKKIILISMLVLFSSPVTAGLKEAVNLSYNGQFTQAISLADDYIKVHPKDPRGLIVKGIALDWKQAILNLKGSLNNDVLNLFKQANHIAFKNWRKNPSNLQNKLHLGISYMFLAKKWIDLDKKTRAGLILKKCKKHIEEVLEKDPLVYEAYLPIGIFNFYAGNLPPGLKFLASLLGISGNERLGVQQLKMAADHDNIHQADALYILVHALGKTKHNYSAAGEYLDTLIAAYPLNPEFLYLKGYYDFEDKKYARSLKTWQAFEKLCVASSCVKRYHYLSFYYRGVAAVKVKDMNLARSFFLEAKKFDEGQYPDKTQAIDDYLVAHKD